MKDSLRIKYLPHIAGFVALIVSLVAAYLQPPFLVSASNQIQDYLLRAQARPIANHDVIVVDIDDRSLAAKGQWPWSRVVMADLLNRLWSAGARVVTFDILFAEKDRSAPVEIARMWSRMLGYPVSFPDIPDDQTDFDALFAQALQLGTSILGGYCVVDGPLVSLTDHVKSSTFYTKGGGSHSHTSDLLKALPQPANMILPLLMFQEAATAVGLFNATGDSDNIIRRTPLMWCQNGQVYPALSLVSLGLFVDQNAYGIHFYEEPSLGVQSVQIRKRTIPVDGMGRLLLNFRTDAFPHFSAADILDGLVDSSVITGRLVLVGTSAAGLRDLVATPLHSEFPGIDVHATAIENMLSGDVLRQPSWIYLADIGVILLLGLLIMWVTSRAGALFSIVLTLILLCGLWSISLWLIHSFHLVIPPIATGGAVLLISGCVILAKYWIEESRRLHFRHIFGNMVSTQVLKFMEDHPDSHALNARKVSATVYFSDIEGFTTITEQVPAEQLSLLMNRYMTAMTDSIMHYDGYVNKFIGDAIMAVWGAPVDDEQHALNACLTALDQVRRLQQLNSELREMFGVQLHFRVGINTGPVTAGNMGSRRRFEFTVLGDTVNQAARLESISKFYGTRILCGEMTRDAVCNVIATRKLDHIVLKGKTQPVAVYEIISTLEELTAADAERIECYEKALLSYFDRQWDHAAVLLSELLIRYPDDGPSLVLSKRIQQYQNTPPPPDWNGAFVAMIK